MQLTSLLLGAFAQCAPPWYLPQVRFLLIVVLTISAASCTHTRPNPYERSSRDEQSQFKTVFIPLPKGTPFRVSQGAFGRYTHGDGGHEYNWDFDVPFGTPVIAAEDSKVIQIWEPDTEGGCDRRYNDSAHNLKIKHADGTVGQYVHIQSRVKVGDHVISGQTIAVTARNGFICTPQLHFGIYLDEQHLPGTFRPQSIPLLFEGVLGNGVAHKGYSGTAP